MKRGRRKTSGQATVIPARDTVEIYGVTKIVGSDGTELKQVVWNLFYLSSSANQYK